MASLYGRAYAAGQGARPRVDPAEKYYADIERGQESLEGAVRGYGEMLRPELLQTIGSALGGLNSIGALRSGATVQALDDIGMDFASRVGQYASQTAVAGANLGLGVRDRVSADEERRRAARASLLRTLGSALGAGVGFVASGFNPAGAAAGYRIAGGGMA